jgi:hypothetical protein
LDGDTPALSVSQQYSLLVSPPLSDRHQSMKTDGAMLVPDLMGVNTKESRSTSCHEWMYWRHCVREMESID